MNGSGNTVHRKERADSFIQQELTVILREKVRDPRVDALTITEVRLTRDRRIAQLVDDCANGRLIKSQSYGDPPKWLERAAAAARDAAQR